MVNLDLKEILKRYELRFEEMHKKSYQHEKEVGEPAFHTGKRSGLYEALNEFRMIYDDIQSKINIIILLIE